VALARPHLLPPLAFPEFFSAGGTPKLLGRCVADGSLEDDADRMLAPLSATRLPLTLKETLGFASPPHDGFAFVVAPERQRLSRVYELGGVQPICHTAIFLNLRRLRHMSGGYFYVGELL
jgi:hypothetical protein